MLDEIKDTRADSARRVLFATAGGLQWLYTATKSNPYKSQIDTEEVERTVQAAKQLDEESATQRKQEIAKNDEQEADEKKKKEQKEAPAAKPSSKWPWKQATLHPAVASMPASAETSINSVAQYIAKREKDPTQRIKALHDYVADRIAYDSASFYAGKYPSQSAKTVFKTRKGVCAGYANLLSALASAMGENIVVVVGDSRESAAGDKLADGGGHAWNAARINGKWYLIDATWDAGSVSREKGFTKEYKTEYLLTPPEVMIQSHFPEKETWQLLDQPLSLGEFMRQPMLSPSFLAANLTLIRPTRAVNETDSNAVVIVKNPDKQWLMVDLEQNGKRIGDGSGATREKYAKLERPLPEKGRYRLNIFLNKESEYGEYDYVGAVDFVNR